MDIFSGANLKVEIGTAGTVVSTTFETVPEVATFTTSGFESAVIDVVTFNSAYNRKLLGTKSVPDIELTVNYLPDDEVHQKLETAADLQKRIQVRLSYYEDATHTTGFYVVYNCFVSSTTIAGDKDAVVTKKFNLAVDQGAVTSGVLPVVGE
ncbi:hypothetical protein [Serratia liquefaciens]|uniref:hypothetical protein n=1 Tax=Serratia liquefaciens TaxID=614 RepID=UPI003F819E49